MTDTFIKESGLQEIDLQFSLTDGKPVKPIKHTLTHFHWYLSTENIELTESQSHELCKRLDNALITYQWLPIKGVETKLISKQLALLKAMVTVLEAQS